ncbi:hypothetical protein INR49_031023 [Caranx melampygus]|nr:hypothetical protein INR49_031023 [Caranx melampygus]
MEHCFYLHRPLEAWTHTHTLFSSSSSSSSSHPPLCIHLPPLLPPHLLTVVSGCLALAVGVSSSAEKTHSCVLFCCCLFCGRCRGLCSIPLLLPPPPPPFFESITCFYFFVVVVVFFDLIEMKLLGFGMGRTEGRKEGRKQGRKIAFKDYLQQGSNTSADQAPVSKSTCVCVSPQRGGVPPPPPPPPSPGASLPKLLPPSKTLSDGHLLNSLLLSEIKKKKTFSYPPPSHPHPP